MSASLKAPVIVETSPPTITAFSVPDTSTTLTVAIVILAASDSVGVTGYLVAESSGAPPAGAAGWSASAPSAYSFGGPGIKTLYAWAKNAAGLVSASLSASVTVNTSFSVTPGAGTGGTISPSIPQTVTANAATSFTVQPTSGYQIASVTGCGGTLSGTTYTTAPISTACTVTATFVQLPVVAPIPSAVTTNSSYRVTGTVTAGRLPATVQITVAGGTAVSTQTTASNGSFSAQVSLSTQSANRITITATDANGNHSAPQTFVMVYSPFTVADALKAYQIAQGFAVATAADRAWMDIAGGVSGGPDGKVNLVDVLAILRRCLGMGG